MDDFRFYRALRDGQPSFGPHLASRQGAAIRHAYMRAAASAIAQAEPGRRLDILEIGSWAGGWR